jgi:hypothetical protein
MNRDRLGPHKSWTMLDSVVQGREVARLLVTETYWLVVMYQVRKPYPSPNKMVDHEP